MNANELVEATELAAWDALGCFHLLEFLTEGVCVAAVLAGGHLLLVFRVVHLALEDFLETIVFDAARCAVLHAVHLALQHFLHERVVDDVPGLAGGLGLHQILAPHKSLNVRKWQITPHVNRLGLRSQSMTMSGLYQSASCSSKQLIGL